MVQAELLPSFLEASAYDGVSDGELLRKLFIGKHLSSCKDIFLFRLMKVTLTMGEISRGG